MSTPRLYRLPSSSHRNTAAGIFVGSLVGVVGGLVLVLWTGTQWAAWKLGYQEGLGPPLFAAGPGTSPWILAAAIAAGAAALGALTHASARRLTPALLGLALVAALCAFGPIYAPWDFFVWELRYGKVPGTEPIWRTGHWLIGVPAHLIFLVGLALAVRRARKLGGRTDSHGSARWAEAEDIVATGLLHPAGVFVGGWWHRGRTRPLRHDGPQHVLGFAPARSGKGVGWVLPTLLSWPHSVLVNDIKGENWALTSGWRRRALGSVCLKFDPTCDDGTAARYNPLLEVRKGPKEIRDVQNIADVLVDPDGAGSLYHDDLVAENTSACDFSITDLMHHERPVSLYLTVPPSDLSRVRPLVRLLINQIGRRLTERMDFEGGRPTPHYRHRLLLMLAWALLDSNQEGEEEARVVSGGCAGGSGLATSWRQSAVRSGGRAEAVGSRLHSSWPASFGDFESSCRTPNREPADRQPAAWR